MPDIRRVGVLGAGLMGSGIAEVCAKAGYEVVVREVDEEALAALRRGVVLDDGPTAPATVRRLRRDTIEITIHEGRKRQVKRMCEHVGHRVRSLERVTFGPLSLGALGPGAHRRLTDAEVAALTVAGAAGGAGPPAA